MAAEAKKHHYVPQSVLRSFSMRGERRSVFVFDKHTQRCFPLPIRDAAAERHFYTVTVGSETLNFEPFFQAFDDRLAELVAKLSATPSIASLSPQERYDLAVVTACQLLRTKLQRTSPVELARQLSERIRESGFPLPDEVMRNEDPVSSIRSLLGIEAIAELLASKDLLLIVPRGPNLWTSDNPVVFHNVFPSQPAALAASGVEIYHPFAPGLCVVFLCRSHREMLAESFDPRHPRPAPTDPFFLRLFESLHTGAPLEVAGNYVTYLNSLQVGQSSRFLYSCDDDFALARKVLAAKPDLREVRTLVRVGGMGTAPPPDSRMPSGTWLVVEVAHRHHMLPVELVASESRSIDFTTTDETKLHLIERDAPFDCVRLFHDQQEMRGMRGVLFKHFELDGRHLVRVQHADESLNRLMEQIDRDRR